jgi:hypothetical protein
MSLPCPAYTKFSGILGTAQTLTFNRTCRVVQIWSDSGASDMYVTLDGTTPTVGGATTIKIAGGASWQSPPNANLGVGAIKYIGSGTTGSYSLLAI